MGYFWGLGQGSRNVSVSTHISEQILYSLEFLLLILSYFVGHIWFFEAQMDYFLDLGKAQQLF